MMSCLRISQKLCSKAWYSGNDIITGKLMQLERILKCSGRSDITTTNKDFSITNEPKSNVSNMIIRKEPDGRDIKEINLVTHLSILSSLVNQNAFMLDDRVQKSLCTIKECFKSSYHNVSSVLEFVKVLRLIGDEEGLMDILPYFIHDVPFMSGNVLSRLTRIYSINFKGSPILSNFYSSVVERMGSQSELFSIDDRLSCILSSFEHINDSKVIFDVLTSYASEINEDLVTNITAMRIYHKAIKERKFTEIPNFTCNLMNVIRKFLQSQNHPEKKGCGSTETIVRYCRLLARLSTIEKDCDGLKEILNDSWSYISKNSLQMTVRDALYMLESMSPDMQTTISSILQYIVPQMSELSLKESMTLLKFINSTVDSKNLKRMETMLESQFALYSDNLNEDDICKILHFYARSNILEPSEFLTNRICERILTIYYASSINFASCIVHLNSLGICKPEIINRFVKYVYNHVISMDPKEISVSLYTLRKLRYNPPQKLLDKVTPVIKGEIRNFKPIDLVYCIYFVAPCREIHKGLFQILIGAIQDKLELLTLDQLVMLSTSLVKYKKQPFVTLMYSQISAHVPSMNANQICSVFSSFASTGLKNEDLTQRLNHYILSMIGSGIIIDDRGLGNLLKVVRRGYANQRLIDCIKTHQIDHVHGFELFDTIPNIDDLSSSDVVSCVLILGNKRQSRENNRLARGLFTRLFTIAPVLSFDLLNQISASISSYGYSKPKINRILANLMAKKAPKVQTKIDENKHLFFRPINRGPPHLKQ
ncbi:hypothetical protein BEWA_001530 [Theileria equi strain WA]|uniref:RNA-editing substrate-binding complex 6 protein domain-containing protein n=1 Tax=Theileria equi strain WA TaxID=1537102 RepID=L0B0F6_THEEQ|nr:hypothetical protein BEWA_001530 [Theileria equi strain WA]AFZ80746.1 hypothetical protein BEWA_001530 [Theileria equi strain WA]|eukprot:XP_004830412.1 hypothetical protein BEWA_001530 [Theileria equi strain WA]